MQRRRLSDRAFALIVVGGFAAAVAFGLWRHEPWRDELQAWMIVRASRTPLQLLDNLRHEGHPPLWYLVLWPWRAVSRSIVVLQCVAFVVAVATVAVVAFRSPFGRFTTACFAFGYFTLFEYGVLARSYGLGLLLTVAALSAARPRAPRQPHSSVATLLLALLPLTSAFGAIVAVTLALALLADQVLAARRPSDAAGPNADPAEASVRAAALRRVVLQTALVFGAAVLAYSQAAPADDAGAFSGWHTRLDAHLASTTIAAVFRALAPIPKFQASWWNTSVLDGHTGLAAVLAIVAAVWIAWIVRRSTAAVVTWCLGTAAIVVFLYLKIGQADAARYYGHILVLFVAAVWFDSTRPTESHLRVVDEEPIPWWASARSLLACVLVLQVVVAIGAVVSDARRPFTDAPAVAEWLQRHGGARAPLIGCHDFAASSVAADLDRAVQYQEGNRVGTFIVWDKRRTRVAASLADATAVAVARRHGTPYYIANVEVPALADRLVFHSDRGIVADEHYWVYDLTEPVPLGQSDPCRKQ